MFKIRYFLITGVLLGMFTLVGTLEAPREVCTADRCEVL
jgi:hypothetical protein